MRNYFFFNYFKETIIFLKEESNLFIIFFGYFFLKFIELKSKKSNSLLKTVDISVEQDFLIDLNYSNVK